MSEQNIARSLTGSTASASLPLAVAEHPDEAPVLAVASLRAGATAAQAGASSGPGSLAYAIERWHANHPDFTAEDAVITVARPPMHTVEPPVGVRIAATRIGCTIAEYFRRQHDGERWCPRCQDWRADWRSAEGRTPYCHPCMREYRRAHYQSVVAEAAQPLRRRAYGVAFAGPSFSKRERAS